MRKGEGDVISTIRELLISAILIIVSLVIFSSLLEPLFGDVSGSDKYTLNFLSLLASTINNQFVDGDFSSEVMVSSIPMGIELIGFSSGEEKIFYSPHNQSRSKPSELCGVDACLCIKKNREFLKCEVFEGNVKILSSNMLPCNFGERLPNFDYPGSDEGLNESLIHPFEFTYLLFSPLEESRTSCLGVNLYIESYYYDETFYVLISEGKTEQYRKNYKQACGRNSGECSNKYEFEENYCVYDVNNQNCVLTNLSYCEGGEIESPCLCSSGFGPEPKKNGLCLVPQDAAQAWPLDAWYPISCLYVDSCEDYNNYNYKWDELCKYNPCVEDDCIMENNNCVINK